LTKLSEQTNREADKKEDLAPEEYFVTRFGISEAFTDLKKAGYKATRTACARRAAPYAQDSVTWLPVVE